MTARNEIVAIDASSVTLKGGRGQGEQRFVVTAETRITRDGEPISIADVAVGEIVRVSYTTDGNRLIARTIAIGVPPPPTYIGPPRVWGSIVSADAEHITIKTATGEQTFKVTRDTAVLFEGDAARKPGTSDVAGQNALITYGDTDTQTAVKMIVGISSADAGESIARPQWLQRHQQSQKATLAAYEAEMAHEGKDCPDARTTYDVNVCMAEVVETTHQNFDVFFQNLLLFVAPIAPSGSHESQQVLKGAQDLWLRYRDETCKGVGLHWEGGTIRPSQEMSCDVRVTRSRMQDLVVLYDLTSHR